MMKAKSKLLLLALAVLLVLGLSACGEKEESAPVYNFYWNVDRVTYTENSETGLSTREKAEDGLYHIRLVGENGLVDMTTPDKQLVNMIDMLPVFAADIDGNSILNAHNPSDLGFTVNRNIYVVIADDTTITGNSSMAMNGMKLYVNVTEQTKILRACGSDDQLGKEMRPTDLMTMDGIYTISDAEGNYLFVYLMEREDTTAAYWRAEAMYSTTTKETTREPDANGVYTIDFFTNGERVSVKCKDKALVSTIDQANRYACHFALVFDEEGYLIATKQTTAGLKALTGCTSFFVTEVNGNTFTAIGGISSAGKTYNGKFAEKYDIFDVSRTAVSEGRQGQRVDSLQIGDRIVCFENVQEEAICVFVTARIADVPIYFNMTRMYSTSKLETTRVPNSKGYYEIEVLKMGSSKTTIVKTKDKDLVSYIDSRADRTYGMIVENGIVEAAYECESLFGYPSLGPRYVTAVNGMIISAMLYKTPTDMVNVVVTPDTEVFDLSGCGKLGAKTTVREGDLVFLHRNGQEEVVAVYIIKRAMGIDHAYWVLGRQYDSDKKVTTRVPDAEGYYVFNMAHKGKQVTVKTKDKAMATYIDSQIPGAVGLTVDKNNIVKYAYDPMMIGGAIRVAYLSTVTKVAKDGTVTADTGTGYISEFKPAEDCKFVNCSEVFTQNKGEYVKKLKVGDMITGYLDMYGEAKVVYIYARDVEEIYWNIQPNKTLAPDAEGYYCFDLAVDGEVKQLKIKNETVAKAINAKTQAFGLFISNGEVVNVTGAGSVVNVNKLVATNWTVAKVDGNKVTLRYDIPGSADYTGKEMKVTMHKWCRTYDVTLGTETPGAKTSLKVGDRVIAYSHLNDQILYFYVTAHDTHQAAADYKCPHCDQVVHWEPYTGGILTGRSGHYYLNGDLNIGAPIHYGSANEETELVLDLNGKTITATNERALAVYSGEILHIVDSVGTGVIQGTGATGKGGSALQVSGGGRVELWGGTLKMLESEQQVRYGGVVYVMQANSNFTMHGGKLDGKVVKVDGKNSIGGAIYAENGSVTVLGGEITGVSEYQGGAIYSAAPVHIENATITGTAPSGASAVYCSNTLTIKNSVINGDVQHNKADAAVLVENSTLSYLKVTAVDTVATLSGKVVINELNLSTGAKVTLNELAEGTSIKFMGDGALTTANEKTEQWLAANYFVADGDKKFEVVDGVLQYKAANPDELYCEHCGQTVIWKPWTYSTQTSGHYYMTASLPSKSGAFNIPAGKELVIDLRGQTINVTNNRAMLIYGKVTIMDTVGGGLVTGNQVGNGGVISVQAGAEVTVLGGTYRSLAAAGSAKGSVAYVVSGGKLTVGGTAVLDGSNQTTGNTATAEYATVYANGDVIVEGGEIKGVKGAPHGGSIFMNAGNLTVSGGTISGGEATYGDDIYTASAASKVVFSGGTVNGQIQLGLAESVTLSGKPVLKNLKVTANSKLTLGTLEDGAQISIAGAGDVSFPSENAATYLEKNYLKAYSATESLKVNEQGVLYIPHCPHCSLPVNTASIQWNAWNYSTATAGHYYLTADLLTKSNQFGINADYIVLDLRGHSIHVTDNRVFNVTNSLTIIDTVGGGTITGTLATTEKGGVFYVNAGATLNLYGGTFRATNALTGSVIYNGGTTNIGGTAKIDGSAVQTGAKAHGPIFSTGTLNITGGEIIGGYVGSGGSVYQEDGKLNISGGYIHGGKAASFGHDIFVTGNTGAGTVTISGGQVEKQIRINKAATVTLSGAPKLGEVKTVNTSGVMLTLGQLLPGADITMAVEGAFTLASDSAKDYVDYFHANAATKYIYEDAGILYMTTKPAQ